MLDHDIDTAPALALLTTRDNDPLSLSRRRFLQLVGLGVGAGLTGGSLLEALGGRETWAGSAGRIERGHPPDRRDVRRQRRLQHARAVHRLATTTRSTARSPSPAAQTLQLNERVGLNPRLTALKRFWDAGQLAVVRGRRLPEPRSQSLQLDGDLDERQSATGSRARDGSGAGSTATCPAAPICTPRRRSAPACRSTCSASNAGRRPSRRVGRASAVAPPPEDLRMYDAIRSVATPAGRGPWHDALVGRRSATRSTWRRR